VSGYTLSIERPELWIQKLKELVSDQSKRGEMGLRGFERMQKCSIEASCQAFIEQHKSVLK